MKKRKIIDISTTEKKKQIFDAFNSLTSKNKAHEYFEISDNTQGREYLEFIAKEVGFDFSIYKNRKTKVIKYCKQCGEEITSKWAKCFCCSSCAAKYNNRHRDKSKSKNLKKKEEADGALNYGRLTLIKKCEFCGKELKASKKYCSPQCQANKTHKEAYEDFLNNNEKYCRGNYTPKAFKKEFIAEQDGKCAICGCNQEHNGKPLIFIIDHIDGDASNNKRDNLRMICPNCDSQLSTFKSKNKNSTRRNYWKEHIFNTILQNS